MYADIHLYTCNIVEFIKEVPQSETQIAVASVTIWPQLNRTLQTESNTEFGKKHQKSEYPTNVLVEKKLYPSHTHAQYLKHVQ